MSQVEIARAVATLAHRGQVDKTGAPYIGHPERVAARLAGDTETVQAAAWLHDVLEDTDLKPDDLRAAGVNESVIVLVDKLTHFKGDTNDQYLAQVYESGSATVIKLADIADNTDIGRLAQLEPDVIARLAKKYAHARDILTGKVRPELDEYDCVTPEGKRRVDADMRNPNLGNGPSHRPQLPNDRKDES